MPGTVITERVREKFKRFSETGRVFFMGAAFTKRIAAEIYHYFEEAVYHRLDMPTRRFLLDLSPFERFDTELAKMVTGSKDAGGDTFLAHRKLEYDGRRHGGRISLLANFPKLPHMGGRTHQIGRATAHGHEQRRAFL